jgi:uncharacterized protein YyaL (SSP411 family)
MTRRFAALIMAMVLVGATPALGGSRLAQETSPYLLSHVNDAVDWRPWGAEALAEAVREGKPILLSIGYSACRWCHVMQRESYTDAETGSIINRHFVPVLIDREERPDVDALYQWKAALLGRPTGWPLTMFLTPEGHAFFGGTYFPKEPVGDFPTFKTVLTRVAETWRVNRDEIAANAAKASAALGEALGPQPGTVTVAMLDGAARELLTMIDPFHGGVEPAPKFPHAVALEGLWRAYLRIGDKAMGDAVAFTLRKMADGGVYDHVGGGFFRYAVDPAWQVPHFEKMLDVNVVLLSLLTEVWRETDDPLLAKRIRETVAFLLNELRLGNGAFATSLDAESAAPEGRSRDGAYYLWSAHELERALGDRAVLFRRAFALAAPEKTTIDGPDDPGTLYRTEDEPAALAKDSGLLPAAVEERLEAALAALHTARAERPKPRRDDKVLADWNALAIVALAEAGLAFNEPRWLDAAAQAFAFAAQALVDDRGRLRQSWHLDRPGALAPVGSIGQMVRAALVLYEATGDQTYRQRAEAWIATALAHHWDKADGGFFAAAPDAGLHVVRLKPGLDNPNPSGNAVVTEVLARLYYLTGDEAKRETAERTLALFGGTLAAQPFGATGLINAADTLRRALQVVVVGTRGEPRTDALLRKIFRTSLPTRVLEVIAPGEPLPETHPAHGKGQVDGLATAYVCRGAVCSLPVTDETALARTLIEMRQGS